MSENDNPGEFRLEYRHDERLWIFKPLFGMSYFTDGGFYGYFGLAVDLFFGVDKKIVLTPSAAVGGFAVGSELMLGHELEFRTGAELAYRFDGGSRLGLSFHHISNANIGDKNPGSEMLLLNYAVPVSWIVGN